ncbi:MAG: EI24 domain-containing protein [bacterium]|nr:EI24 domain-containing protein [bacterium]MBU1919066.1 EI24 domain-containing protein [bacterium]
MLKDFFTGLSYSFKGFGLFSKHHSLWKFALIPFIINVLALILILSLYFLYFNDIFSFITTPLGALDITAPENVFWHILDALLWVVRFLMKALFFLFSFILIFVVIFALSSFINAPFYELLTEQILILHNDLEDRPFKIKNFLSELKHTLAIELYKLLVFASISIALFIGSLIPVLGPFFTLLGFFFAAWVFAFGLCTYPMLIKKHSFKEMISWALNNKSLLVGFGILSTIPVIGILTIHFQVAGSALIHMGRKA